MLVMALKDFYNCILKLFYFPHKTASYNVGEMIIFKILETLH